MRALPNLVTGLRLALALVVVLALAAAAGAAGWLTGPLSEDDRFALERWAFAAFVLAALSDFLDGWLARRLSATSMWGATLDPVADKALIAAAILGLLALGPNPAVIVPAALILVREFAVSALRETVAGKGLSLPVTWLAKWKTTLQLVALGAELIVASWRAFGLPDHPPLIARAALGAHALLWVAAIVTVITGAQYWAEARRKLSGRG
jgi:CDP-diacylglycerol--glycerol-3-phosphate 3-phosphatidyltransferase